MDKVCTKIKEKLEMCFSMPFDVSSFEEDGETHYTCIPTNEGENFFSITVYIHNQIRLVLEMHPQKHGGYILEDMAMATTEKRHLFFQYKQMLENKGAKVSFLVNHSRISENEEWPSKWKSFHSKITKIPIPDEENAAFDFIIEWLQHGISLIFTLLHIVDVPQEDVAQTPVQTEGTPHEIMSVRYERNPINRELCLFKKGYTCAVCGMNFYDIYGEIGKNFIEVHHTTPVSAMGPGYELDIERDLVPLCSNCHSMVHRKKPPYDISELRSFYEERNYGSGSMVAEDEVNYNAEVRDLIVGVVKSEMVDLFKKHDAKRYYFGKKFPSTYNLKCIQYFAPYFEGGIRGYYDVRAIRTARKADILEQADSNEDNDTRIVLDLGKYHHISEKAIGMKLVQYSYANISLKSLEALENK